jgi:hypothetical protein
MVAESVLKFWRIYTLSTPVNVNKWVLQCIPFACIDLPFTERLGRFCSYSIFKSSFILGRFLVNMNLLAGLQMRLKPQNGGFLEAGSYDSDQILVVYGTHLPN